MTAKSPCLPVGLFLLAWVALVAPCGGSAFRARCAELSEEISDAPRDRSRTFSIRQRLEKVPASSKARTDAIQRALCQARPGDVVEFGTGRDCSYEIGYYTDFVVTACPDSLDGSPRVRRNVYAFHGLVGRHGVTYLGGGCTLRLADRPKDVPWSTRISVGSSVTERGGARWASLLVLDEPAERPTVLRQLNFDGNREGQRQSEPSPTLTCPKPCECSDGTSLEPAESKQRNLDLSARTPPPSFVGDDGQWWQRVEVVGSDSHNTTWAGFSVAANIDAEFSGARVSGRIREEFRTGNAVHQFQIHGARTRVDIRQWTSVEDDQALHYEPLSLEAPQQVEVTVRDSTIVRSRYVGISWTSGNEAWSRTTPRNRLTLDNVRMIEAPLNVHVFDTEVRVTGGAISGIENPVIDERAPSHAAPHLAALVGSFCGSVHLEGGLKLSGWAIVGSNAPGCTRPWTLDLDGVELAGPGRSPRRWPSIERRFALLAEWGSFGHRDLRLTDVTLDTSHQGLLLAAGGLVHLGEETWKNLPEGERAIYLVRDTDGPAEISWAPNGRATIDGNGWSVCRYLLSAGFFCGRVSDP